MRYKFPNWVLTTRVILSSGSVNCPGLCILSGNRVQQGIRANLLLGIFFLCLQGGKRALFFS